MPKLQPTLHKGFNKVAFSKRNDGWLFTGNAITDIQFSWYIRRHSQTGCNGLEFPKGYLRDVDLKMFDTSANRLPPSVRLFVNGIYKDDIFVIYQIKFRGVIGYVLENLTKKVVVTYPMPPFTLKRSNVLLSIADIIRKDSRYV